LGLGLLMVLIAITTYQACWLWWFLLEPLPNAGNVGGNGLNRLLLLIRGVPEVMVPGLKYRDSYLGLALAELSHFDNLPQRVPIVLAAAFIAASGITLGNLILRALRLRSALDPWECLAVGYGLGTTGLGLATLVVGRLGLLDPWAIRIGLAAPIVVELVARFVGFRRVGRAPGEPHHAMTVGLARGSTHPTKIEASQAWPVGAILGFGVVAGPFLLIMALGAMLPTIDFDAIEYHLQGPKEYYQAGRIAFLPHNVYTSMPFSIEMLHLLGMEVVGDWWLGALVGQLLVALFAPMAAVLIGLTARKIGSDRAAWVTAIAYLTTPWIYRLAVLPYVEGPLCYFHAALIWAILRTQESGSRIQDSETGDSLRRVGRASGEPHHASMVGLARGSTHPTRLGLLVGLLAGGAMAIKYPALISAVIPFSGWAAWAAWRSRDWRIAGAFGLGVAVVMAPWLGKNVIDTGNPVYPLGYKVFGASHWDQARDAKWSSAHGPKPIEGKEFVRSVVDVAGRSDWQSPIFAALAPLAFLRREWRKNAGLLAAYSLYLFLTWWLFTHRLDRFWLPILPPLAILAGLGADWVGGRSWFGWLWTGWLAVVMGLSIATNAVYCSTALAGMNEWTGDLTRLRTSVPRMLNAPLTRLDSELPARALPLLVGQAAVFHLNRPILYNTVFNEETIETIAKGRSLAEVGKALRRLGVTHVYVDWFEIDRYRSPGNYGFTSFVQPVLFSRLVEAGVLKPPTRLGLRQELFEVR
jgi:4-amino-4-deoxy-L-arabinose transferase-like glycosyltransferase